MLPTEGAVIGAAWLVGTLVEAGHAGDVRCISVAALLFEVKKAVWPSLIAHASAGVDLAVLILSIVVRVVLHQSYCVQLTTDLVGEEVLNVGHVTNWPDAAVNLPLPVCNAANSGVLVLTDVELANLGSPGMSITPLHTPSSVVKQCATVLNVVEPKPVGDIGSAVANNEAPGIHKISTTGAGWI